MKKILLLLLLAFMIMLGLEIGNDKKSSDYLNEEIAKFEQVIDNHEEINLNKGYNIKGNVLNNLAKKSEGVLKKLVDKLREYI